MARNTQPTGTYDPATGAFVPVKKKKARGCLWFVLVPVILIFVIVAAFGGKTDTGPADDSAETAAADPETEAPETAAPETEAPAPETDPPEPEEPAGVESGTYTISGVDYIYTDYVLGDKTKTWTKAVCYSTTPPDTVARELCETFHPETGVPLWICNLYLKTTTRILSWGTMLDVTVTEYVDGEENRADILGSGMQLSQTMIDLTEDAP